MIRINILTVACVILISSSIKVSSQINPYDKRIDKELGAWISNNDTFIITFFDDHTFLKITSEGSMTGKWKKGTYPLVLCDYDFANSNFDKAAVLSIEQDKLTWHHGDYDSDNFFRILKADSDSLFEWKKKERVPSPVKSADAGTGSGGVTHKKLGQEPGSVP